MYKSTIPGIDRTTVDDLWCDGCLAERKSMFCRYCKIRDCTTAHSYEGCHRCDTFPCEHIDNFPMPVGKKVILRTIPYWKEHGTEKFVRDEESRYTCPQCGNALFRGAKRCNTCKTPVELD